MRFRPCIDIHNGKVKQIVGGSLKDQGDQAKENFVSGQDASFFADLYKNKNLSGGHIILLNGKDSPYYEETRRQSLLALKAFPKGMQIGGGITRENAAFFLENGASKVIVTSYVFQKGEIHYKNLEALVSEVGKENLVLDLSCRKKEGEYYIVTDRWQNYTNVVLNEKSLNYLSDFCNEFLVHAVDVEGKASGIEEGVASLLGNWAKCEITYAGGIHTYEDLELLKKLGKEKIDFTVGSALDLFGGNMEFEKIAAFV